MDIRGSKDLLLGAPVVAGGEPTADGVVHAGPDSDVVIKAGRALNLSTGVYAARNITVETGSAGLGGVGSLSLVIATDGGLISAGYTSDVSGGKVDIYSEGDIELMGIVLAGGKSKDGVITWSREPTQLEIEALGRLWVGGNTVNTSNQPIEVGGTLLAYDRIDLKGGSHPTGEGVQIPGSAGISVRDPNGIISIISAEDAILNGTIVAGGEIVETRDANDVTLGSDVVLDDGDSQILVVAGNQDH